VVDLAPLDGIAQRFDGRLLTDDLVKSARPMAAVEGLRLESTRGKPALRQAAGRARAASG